MDSPPSFLKFNYYLVCKDGTQFFNNLKMYFFFCVVRNTTYLGYWINIVFNIHVFCQNNHLVSLYDISACTYIEPQIGRSNLIVLSSEITTSVNPPSSSVLTMKRILSIPLSKYIVLSP